MAYLLFLFLSFASIGVALALTNTTPSTWLTGWDNLHPEFNLPMNIGRSLSAVWQEYQGPGLLGGMAHATALPREVMLWLFSLVMPIASLRYVWTFLLLFIGSFGAAILVRHIAKTLHPNASHFILTLAGFSGGIFYLFNLATVQTFFAPFEAFITHFAVLPWLLWAVVRILEKPSVRRLAAFAVINVVGATHAYIPTLFFVYLTTLTILTGWHILLTRSFESLQRVVLIFLITFLTNVYWLLPFGYFATTGTATTVNAKINQMATDDIYLRNQKYGTIGDTLALRNFWFDNVEYNPITGSSDRMMDAWRAWGEKPWVVAASAIAIGVVLVGAVLAVRKKETVSWFLVGLVAFTMIAIDAPPFSLVISALRDHFPLFSQFLRFPFTKWAATLSLAYSVFFGISVLWIISHVYAKRRITPLVVFALFVALPVVTALPVFSGNLISERVRIAIPDEYFSLFEYFHIKPQGRIAILPQPNFWDWRYYRWGALGSGFLWYGIQQPILDRSFDVWSSVNENAYWELSYALFSKNTDAIEAVLNKYDVSYVILDKNLVTTSHSRALFTQESESILPELPEFTLDATFGNILVFTRIVPQSDTFVQLTGALPSVSPVYTWTDNDVVFRDNDIYNAISRDSADAESTYYPFRELFTKRTAQELPYAIRDDNEQITITSSVPTDRVIPPQESQKIYPQGNEDARPYATLMVSGTEVSASIDKVESVVYATDDTGVFDPRAVFPCGLLSPGVATGSFRYDGTEHYLELSSLAEQGCLSFGMLSLPHNIAYIAAVTYKHETGRPLLLAFINQSAKHTEIETYLTRNTDWTTDYFILPPLSPDGLGYTVYLANDAKGRYKTVNDIKSIRVYRFPYNELVRLRFPPKIQDVSNIIKPEQFLSAFSVYHPNTSYYRITIDNPFDQAKTLVLNQSYHTGWRAYEIETCDKGQVTRNSFILSPISCLLSPYVPFLFGHELKEHVLVNNWANGWILPEQTTDNKQLTTIVIFFLPQLLEWIGFALLLLTVPILLLYGRTRAGRIKA